MRPDGQSIEVVFGFSGCLVWGDVGAIFPPIGVERHDRDERVAHRDPHQPRTPDGLCGFARAAINAIIVRIEKRGIICGQGVFFLHAPKGFGHTIS